MSWGDLIKKRRIELGLNLRKFCQQHGHDPSNWSKYERGILKPPSEENTLSEIASQLQIEQTSELWLQFIDSAYIDRGNIPPYVLENEKLMEKLPLFFRTASGNKPSEEDLDKVAEFLKRNP